MKKTLMTFLAVGFGVSVAFAQTTGEGTQQEDTELNQQQTEQSDNLYGQEEEGKRQIEMYELPVAVQDAFKNGQYSDWEVLAIYEMTDDKSQQGTEGVGVGTDTETDQGVKYAFELVQNGQGDQSAMGQEDDVTTDDGLSGVETERVSEREADMMVVFDENGQVVKEKNADEIKKDKEHKKDHSDY